MVQPVHLLDDHLHQLRALGAGGDRPRENLRRGAKDTERRAHLVRHTGGDFPYEGELGGCNEVVLGTFQLGRHGVEGHRQLPDFVARPDLERAAGLARVRNLLRCPRQGTQRPAHPPGEEGGDGEGDEQHGGQRHGEPALHVANRRERLGERLHDERDPAELRMVGPLEADQNARLRVGHVPSPTARVETRRHLRAGGAQLPHGLRAEVLPPRLADHRPPAVEQQHVHPEPVRYQGPADASRQRYRFLPIVPSEQGADHGVGLLGHADRRRNLHRRRRVVRRGDRSPQELLAPERGARPVAVAEHLAEPARVAGRHHPPVAVDAEEIEVRRPAVGERAQKARGALVQVADHDVPHDILPRPGADVVALPGEGSGQLLQRLVRHLAELLAHGVLEGAAGTRECD